MGESLGANVLWRCNSPRREADGNTNNLAHALIRDRHRSDLGDPVVLEDHILNLR